MSDNACSKKLKLVAEYESAVRQHSMAATELNNRIGTVSKGQFEKLRAAASAAEETARNAKTLLDQHIQQHKC